MLKNLLPLLLLVPLAQAMEPLDDQALGQITGREGVLLDLALYNNVDDNNQPINCDGPLNPCRIGIEFAANEGIWLMLKENYGTFRLTGLQARLGFLPGSHTSYYDAERFENEQGECLIADCDPRGLPTLLLNYPENKGPAEYGDLHTFFNIGRTALEYDDGATPGYLRDQASGSFLGYRISDSSGVNAEAQARFRGTSYVFGF